MELVFQDVSDTITAGFAKHHGASGGKDSMPRMHMSSDRGVRTLTVVECERLQGFPEGHTEIPYLGRNRDECPHSPRLRSVGNSMAVTVMRWIGERIACQRS